MNPCFFPCSRTSDKKRKEKIEEKRKTSIWMYVEIPMITNKVGTNFIILHLASNFSETALGTCRYHNDFCVSISTDHIFFFLQYSTI
jgi:hypothetical protein